MNKNIDELLPKEYNKPKEAQMGNTCISIKNLSKREQSMVIEKVSELASRKCKNKKL